MPQALITIEFFTAIALFVGAVSILGNASLRTRRHRTLIDRVKSVRFEVKKATIMVTSSTSGAISASYTVLRRAADGIYGLMPDRTAKAAKSLLADALRLVRRAESLLGQGDMQEAKQLLVSALATDPDYVPALRALALLCEKEGQTAQAEQIIMKIIELGAEDAGTYEQLGRILESEGRMHPAIQAYERAAELSPKKADLQAHLAQAAAADTQWDVARRAYAQAYHLEPKKHEYLLCFAQACTEVGEKREAATALEKYLAHKPYDNIAKELLESVSGPKQENLF